MGLVSSLRKIYSIIPIFPPHNSLNQTTLFAEDRFVATPPPPPALENSSNALPSVEPIYVIHLDLESPAEERLELASRVEKDPIFAKVGNVFMITKANMVTYRGPTMVANTLHACAILLKRSKDWDWFINLSASDYPLVTQDDLLHTFSDLDRELNFIEHTSHLGWKAHDRAMPLIVDPALYQSTKQDIFWVTPRRTLPTAFKLFTGSAWMILSRSFVEYVVWGWDNFPRVLLMYYTNFVSPRRKATSRPSYATGAAFARKFSENDPVLDRIDKQLLGRRNGSFTLGGWCAGKPRCSKVGNPTKLKPGPGALRLRQLIDRLLLQAKSSQNQCK
ncbi:core-2/I-branching beta-1,6-N-acetylglucosaminyltransferase family protein [Actinidia rufa]|uniref:Core-2/I-branching beta-1,6-N-acetylglucosaminyltransferase family protein n=1 Tax=Actinidia rufa TaxID=165716 RepID=A0A7J0DI39_9ERIC|nr:core-2/I-branching beta-1,6-N-acetylglucosaminyltransferase family protein [Actinidia rufa]